MSVTPTVTFHSLARKLAPKPDAGQIQRLIDDLYFRTRSDDYPRNPIGYDEGVILMEAESPAQIGQIMAIASMLREKYCGNGVKLCSITNAKSGLCAEDCGFCAQSSHYDTGVKTYDMMEPQQIAAAAADARQNGGREFSIVASGTGITSGEDLQKVKDALNLIKDEVGIERCASLGIMTEQALGELKQAGLQHFHHNLETARSFYKEICSTHDYQKNVDTVRMAKAAGFETCSGGIFGMGESRAQRVEMAMELRDLAVDHIPINFLNPRPGTPLEHAHYLTPLECLKIIAVFRIMHPERDILVMGGRELNLKEHQGSIFFAGANGTMVGNYLTTSGRPGDEVRRMVEDAGLHLEEPRDAWGKVAGQAN